MAVMKPKKKTHRTPVKLEVNGKVCGCTFLYRESGDGFTYVCDVHVARRKALRAKRKQANRTRYSFLGPISS